MYGVSKITSEQDVMLITFPGTRSSTANLAGYLEKFARNGIVVDMICQTAPRGSVVDFSFTTTYDHFTQVMKTFSAGREGEDTAPLISSGYSKINLFGEEMVASCGVAARALQALAQQNVEVALITTSDLDISLLIRQESEDDALGALRAAFEL